MTVTLRFTTSTEPLVLYLRKPIHSDDLPFGDASGWTVLLGPNGEEPGRVMRNIWSIGSMIASVIGSSKLVDVFNHASTEERALLDESIAAPLGFVERSESPDSTSRGGPQTKAFVVLHSIGGKTSATKQPGVIDIDVIRTPELEARLAPLRTARDWDAHGLIWTKAAAADPRVQAAKVVLVHSFRDAMDIARQLPGSPEPLVWFTQPSAELYQRMRSHVSDEERRSLSETNRADNQADSIRHGGLIISEFSTIPALERTLTSLSGLTR